VRARRCASHSIRIAIATVVTNTETCSKLFSHWGYATPVVAHAENRNADRSPPMTYVKDSIIPSKIKAKQAADHPGRMESIQADTDKDGVV